ncbi:MAG: HAD-IA family hydrolase [Spirochaetales bacterium]|nr:HAD-IA family hydrolase [Spirochaetales bacterium]
MNNGWILRENEKDRDNYAKSESLFSLGNGYLGFRGNTAEISGNYFRGVYLNGFYETQPIRYSEKAYGYPQIQQTMLNLPDGRITEISIGDDRLDSSSPYILSSDRKLDMRSGILYRQSEYNINGRKITIQHSCLVHARHQELAIQDISIISDTPLHHLSICSWLLMPGDINNDGNDPRIGRGFDHVPLVITRKDFEGNRGGVWLQAPNSGMHCYCGIKHDFGPAVPELKTIDRFSPDLKMRGLEFRYELDDFSGSEFRFQKYLVYRRGRDENTINSIYARADGTDYPDFLAEHCTWWENFWDSHGIDIEGDKEALLSLRFSMFQLVQSAGRDGQTSVAAKGLTGEGYEGHYFWDTEIYMQPFFSYSLAPISRALIQYRASRLDRAIQRAAELSQKGALYPWRTINGDETSSYFPASTAQYHINGDIMYAVFRYLRVTRDYDLLLENDCAVLRMAIETARLWLDLGFFNKYGKFCIHEVTGPDEYTALVNNNFYTNTIARYQLLHTADLVDMLKSEYGCAVSSFLEKWQISDSDLDLWRKAAESIFIPYDESLGIYAQDDSFLQKEIWDFQSTPSSKFPLLLHFHPLVIYRYQVLKQADAIMAFFTEPDAWPVADKIRTFDYYEALTTGDSSLSACIQGIVAAQLGRKSLAAEYFKKTAFLDLHDIQGNTRDGLHLAAAGGTWCLAVYGFAGLDDSGDILQFNPCLPVNWSRLVFTLHYRQGMLNCSFTDSQAVFDWQGPAEIKIKLENSIVLLKPESHETLPIKPALKGLIIDIESAHISDDGSILAGIASLLRECQKEKISCALVSSAQDPQQLLLDRHPDFEVIIDPASVRMRKPDPEIYLTAANSLGLKPKYCAGIINTPSGTEALKSAGIVSVGIGSAGEKSDLALEDVPHLSIDILKTLFEK